MSVTDIKSSPGSTGAVSAAFDPQIIKDFLSDMSFDCNIPLSSGNQDLEAMVMAKFAELGLSDYDFQPMAYLHKPSCLFADLCHGSQPLDFKVFVAVYAILTIGVDDLFLNTPEIQTFTLKFGRGELQGHPHLDCLVRHLTLEAPKFFGPCGVNFIISSTLDAINGFIIESRFPHGFPSSLGGFSAWVRAKVGYGEAYGYFIFPQLEFPESEWLGRYIQGLPSLRDIICYINDIISFYKERVLRQENSLISNLAEENGCDVITSLKGLCARTVTITHNLRRGYAEEGGALLEAFDSFVKGYIKWHLNVNRYHLDEIGLRLLAE